MSIELPAELKRRLVRGLEGELHDDLFNRGRYATDASVYQIMPAAVAVPKSVDDLHLIIEASKEYGLPITARGGGTSQCGQTINHGLIVDNSRHLNQLLSLDVEKRRCIVQPGMVLDTLNQHLKPHGLWFPVDVSTASRATIGGMAANNSCGQRSIHYGTMRDNVSSIDAILPDNNSLHFGSLDTSRSSGHEPHCELFAELLALGQREARTINDSFPKVLRRVGGYNIDALMPEHAAPNLSHLLVGSEGTLAYSTAIELHLSRLPQRRVLGVCHFPSFYAAMDATQHLVELGPHAVELVDDTMLALAADIDMYRSSLTEFVRGTPAALLLVEFACETDEHNLQKLAQLEERMSDLGFNWQGNAARWGGVVRAIDPRLQARIGEVRKAGLNIMMSMKSERKPISFVEDCAVELADLAEFTDGLTQLFDKHGTSGTWYAHASVGCLHVRPVLNLKLEQDANTMRAIAEEAFDLVQQYKGSHSGEHGDGIARSEFHGKMFGARMVRNFEHVKHLFDPDNLFNPGKIVNAPRMNDRQYFRFKPDYRMIDIGQHLDWSDWPGASGGLQGAIEMCNNNGACRKLSGGSMCPSYRVTRDERDTTRGRANTLRLALSGQLGTDALQSDAMQDTLKLCVSCKACKRECPTGVDMAKMKLEVQAQYTSRHGYTLHDRLIAHLPYYAPWAYRLRWLANLRNRSPLLAKAMERVTGFSANRALPEWSARPFLDVSEHRVSGNNANNRTAVLLADTFNTWFEPDNLRHAIVVLEAAGFTVVIANTRGQRRLCCGRTYLSSGMLDKAKLEARRLVDTLLPWAQTGAHLVGLEPSCLLTLRDEYPVLIPGPDTDAIASKAVMLEELIIAEQQAGRLDWTLRAPGPRVLVHGHCHQKALGVWPSVQQALSLIPDMTVEAVESSCCGMAGAFGYGKDTESISRQMGELSLLPAVRKASADALIVADGTSCRHQIADGANRRAIHVAEVFARALGKAG